MKKTSIMTGAILSAGVVFGMAQPYAGEKPYKVEGNAVDETTWVGAKIYDRAFGRGCGTCHDIQTNPNLLESVKKLSKEEFVTVVKNGRIGKPGASGLPAMMPPAIAAIMDISLVKKANMTEDQAVDAIYNYLLGRSNGDIPAGELTKLK